MLNDAPPARSRRVLALAGVAVVLVALLSFLAGRPPAPRGLDAPTADFSALRARTHLEVIARVPHPVGSPAHDEVRAYIVRVLDELGLKPQVQEASTTIQVVGSTAGASIKNVVARLHGTNGTGRAVMLSAHYDSVPQSLGASDDGSGVATLLETARALASSPAPANDVVFLFTDGEEIGLLGAQAFVDSNPAAKDVAVALNFDARGASGVVAMYDTSRGNGALIATLARSAPRVTSTSLLPTIARVLPNDTDATIFANAGMATYAFAYVDDLFRYHQQTESIDALDLGSLQHDGDYALPRARARERQRRRVAIGRHRLHRRPSARVRPLPASRRASLRARDARVPRLDRHERDPRARRHGRRRGERRRAVRPRDRLHRNHHGGRRHAPLADPQRNVSVLAAEAVLRPPRAHRGVARHRPVRPRDPLGPVAHRRGRGARRSRASPRAHGSVRAGRVVPLPVAAARRAPRGARLALRPRGRRVEDRSRLDGGPRARGVLRRGADADPGRDGRARLPRRRSARGASVRAPRCPRPRADVDGRAPSRGRPDARGGHRRRGRHRGPRTTRRRSSPRRFARLRPRRRYARRALAHLRRDERSVRRAAGARRGAVALPSPRSPRAGLARRAAPRRRRSRSTPPTSTSKGTRWCATRAT